MLLRFITLFYLKLDLRLLDKHNWWLGLFLFWNFNWRLFYLNFNALFRLFFNMLLFEGRLSRGSNWDTFHLNRRYRSYRFFALSSDIFRNSRCIPWILKFFTFIDHICLVGRGLVKFLQFNSRNKRLDFLSLILNWLSLIGRCRMGHCGYHLIFLFRDKFI